MASRNIRLVMAYDGTDFAGWQIQANDRTVQGVVEAGLERLLGEPVRVRVAGRTDSGVHARGQVANFTCDTRINTEAFRKGLNSMLGGAIVIRSCETVSESFHSRYDVIGKTYRYRIHNHQLPRAMGRQYHWHLRTSLDIEAMQTASSHLMGRHDFKSFEGAGSPRQHSVRKIVRAEWTQAGDHCLEFFITGNGFLRFMVRNIVGTFVEVGQGKRPAGDIPGLLAARDRSLAGPTAPPQGLCLMEVEYD